MESYQKELVRIKKILKDNPRGMTVTDIAREIDINRNSVAKYLDILLISGHAEMITFGPAKVFFPSRRIPISAMLNFTLDYIVLLDKELKVVQINDNLLNLLDISRDEIMGDYIENSTFPIFHLPDLVNHAKKALNGQDSVIETKFNYDSQEYYFRVKNIPTTFDDGEAGVTLIIEDITENKNIQEKMKEIINEWETTFNSISDLVSIHDNNFKIIKVNESFTKFFNKSPEELIGKKCHEVVHGNNDFHKSCPCSKAKKSKKPESVEFYEPYLKKYLEISVSPIINENGEITGSVHIMKDITERKSNDR